MKKRVFEICNTNVIKLKYSFKNLESVSFGGFIFLLYY